MAKTKRIDPQKEQWVREKKSFYDRNTINQLLAEVDFLREAVKMAGNACGIAATFLEFHGVDSPQLRSCVKMMENHEKIALKAIAERAAAKE